MIGCRLRKSQDAPGSASVHQRRSKRHLAKLERFLKPAINPKLLKMENVLLPHMGSATIEGRIAMGEKVIINIKTFADGHAPPDHVFETIFWTKER